VVNGTIRHRYFQFFCEENKKVNIIIKRMQGIGSDKNNNLHRMYLVPGHRNAGRNFPKTPFITAIISVTILGSFFRNHILNRNDLDRRRF